MMIPGSAPSTPASQEPSFVFGQYGLSISVVNSDGSIGKGLPPTGRFEEGVAFVAVAPPVVADSPPPQAPTATRKPKSRDVVMIVRMFARLDTLDERLVRAALIVISSGRGTLHS